MTISDKEARLQENQYSIYLLFDFHQIHSRALSHHHITTEEWEAEENMMMIQEEEFTMLLTPVLMTAPPMDTTSNQVKQVTL